MFEIGGADVLTYAEMLTRTGKIQNGREIPVVTVPLFTPNLSSYWLALITDVDVATGRNLIESMSTEVVVHDPAILDVVRGSPMGYDEAVRLALAEQDLTRGRFGRELLRTRLAGLRRTQAVFRRNGQRGGGHGQELVRRHLGQADALLDRAAGAERQGRGGESEDGGGAKTH